MKSVVLLGGFPPPVGGNSVHIERLAIKLASSGYRCQVIDPYSSEPVSGERSFCVTRVGGKGFLSLIKAGLLIRKIKPDVIHIHVSAMEKFVYAGPILFLLSGRSAKRVLTIHSGSFVKRFLDQSSFKRLFTIGFLKKFSSLIAVNFDQKKVLAEHGCDKEKIAVVPAYLPAEVTESSTLRGLVDKAGFDGKKLLVTSGYGLQLYGYEKIIEALSIDPNLAKEFRLVVCLYNTYDEDYLGRLNDSISRLDDAVVLRGLAAGEFAYLLGQASVYVRATDRDGDAVAIREANSFGVKVIATSVVLRPEYCTLFDRNQTSSLIKALRDSLREGGVSVSVDEDNFKKVVANY